MKNKTCRGYSRKKEDFYSAIAPFYDILTGCFLRPVRKGASTGAQAQKCSRVLDVACGTGEQAITLANAGIDVTGIDLSPAMLRVARDKSPQAIAYILGSAEALPFGSGSFDCATISLALHEMAFETSMGTTREMLRVLQPGGKLIAFDYAAPKNWKSAFALALLGLVERIAGKEHFKNFVAFTRMGGIDRFLEAFPLKLIRHRNYFLGALRLVLAEKIE